jgi:hypothetical protein
MKMSHSSPFSKEGIDFKTNVFPPQTHSPRQHLLKEASTKKNKAEGNQLEPGKELK